MAINICKENPTPIILQEVVGKELHVDHFCNKWDTNNPKNTFALKCINDTRILNSSYDAGSWCKKRAIKTPLQTAQKRMDKRKNGESRELKRGEENTIP